MRTMIATLTMALDVEDGTDPADAVGAYLTEHSTRYLVEGTEVREDGAEPKITDGSALDSIAALLSGERWHVEDLETIAEYIRLTGRTIAGQ